VREQDEFRPRFDHIQVEDISYGREWLKVPCVNSIDTSYPPYTGEDLNKLLFLRKRSTKNAVTLALNVGSVRAVSFFYLKSLSSQIEQITHNYVSQVALRL
jgi:hypothetical protein